MLTKLFNNISLASLAHSFIFQILWIIMVLNIGFDQEVFLLKFVENEVFASKYLFYTLSIIILPLSSFVLNSAINSFGVWRSNYFITSILTVFWTLFLSLEPTFNTLLLIAIFTWFAVLLLKIYSTENCYSLVFDLAFLIGCATLINKESLILMLILYLGLTVFRRIGIRYYIIPILGLGAALSVSWGISYLINDVPISIESQFEGFFVFKFSRLKDLNVLNLIPFGILLAISVPDYLKINRKAKVLKKTFMAFVFLSVVISLLSLSLGMLTVGIMIFLLNLAILLSNKISYSMKWYLKDLYFLLGLLASLLLIL